MQQFYSRISDDLISCIFSTGSSNYSACRQIWCRNSVGQFRLVRYFDSSDLSFLDDFIVNENCDYYITANSFYADRRSLDSLFSIDNFVFDIDCHDSSVSSDYIKFDCHKFLFSLSRDYANVFPAHSVAVFTGRGLQIWLHIDSISSKLLFLYRMVAHHFCNVLQGIIDDMGLRLNVDVAASTNAVGLFRMPYTYNTVSGLFVDTDYVAGGYFPSYNIDDLISEYNISKTSDRLSVSPSEQRRTGSEDYKMLHYKRIRYLDRLVADNPHQMGRRDCILFLYYNALVQVYSRSNAVVLCNCLNCVFSEPLLDLQYIYDYIDSKGYLLFSNDTFIRFLGLSSSEQEDYINMGKYKCKIDRQERDKLIKQLACQLHTCDYIAEQVGCSVRTVKTVLNDFDKKSFLAAQVKVLRRSMTVAQVADALCVSRRTIQRLQIVDT